MMGLTTAKNIAKQVEDENYFEITKFQLKKKEKDTDKQEADATVRCNYNSNTVDTAGGTNIQAGLYRGIKMLKEAGNTTVELDDGSKVTRAPNLILMSDGAPTTFTSALDSSYVDEDGKENTDVSIDSDKSKLEDPPKHEVPSGSWWGELTGKQIGAGNNNEPDSADGFMAMLTAAYGKEQITQHYYQGEEGKSAKIYTIGFSTDKQTDDMAAMANLVLNPEENLITGNVDDVTGVCEEVKKVSSAWQDYQSGKKTVVTAPLGTGTNSTKYQYVVAQVKENGTIYPQSLVYTDKYYSADSKDSLDSAFSDIVQSIVTGAKMPTQVTGSATSSGYLTYKDPLGQYMQVDSVKAILWNGHKFLPSENPTIEKDEATNTTVTTYHFAGTINNPAYTPANDVSNIRITVTEKEDKTQEVEIKIPAAAIPLRVNTVTTGSNYSLTSNEALPVRIVYGVSLRDEVMADEDHVNLDALSNEYLAKNQKDGKVYFYSNLYSETSIGNTTVGDASVTFTPAENNPFYYMQKDTYLFEDEDFQTPVTNTTLDPEKTYYFEASYYDKTGYKTVAVERKGQDFLGVTPKTDDEGKVYLPEGSPRLGNLNQFVKTKANNAALTNTAATYYYPHYMGSFYASGASTLAEGAQGDSFGIALGNNGSMGVAPAEGSLTISKSVTADAGLTAPDATFTFQVALTDQDGNGLTGTYTYATPDGNTATITNGSASVSLKDRQSVTIDGLPAGTHYTVTETNVPKGFTPADEMIEDDIAANQKSAASFVNNYSATSATLTLNGSKTINKQSEDAAGAENAQPAAAAAMLSMATEETATAENAQSDAAAASMMRLSDEEAVNQDVFRYTVYDENNNAVGHGTSTGEGAFQFNALTFTRPATYNYTIREDNDGSQGIDYDETTHTLAVTVKDNGEGALFVDSWSLDGAAGGADTVVSFTNTYTTNLATVNLEATKNLTGRKMKAGEFTFEVTDNATDTVKSTGKNDADGLVKFSAMTYTVEDAGKTFTYTVREKPGDGNKGLTYDTTTYTVTVSVADDGQGNLTATVTGDENMVFNNSYEAANGSVSLDVRKVLEGGRDLTAGEFTFLLQDVNGNTISATNEADGVVNFPAITYSKKQLEGETSKDFTFTVREEKGEDATVEYDETVYKVVIRVTDNGEGAIVPEVFSVTDEKGNVVEDGKMVFTNTVKPEETPEPSPEVTPSPEPTPEVTPTPTPEVTPTPAPEVTPSPAPEVTPTPAPETTPAPEESSEQKTTTTTSSTPAPTATPAPAATPAPTATPAPATVIPQTGDASHPALWALLLVASAGAAAVLWVYKRKRQ